MDTMQLNYLAAIAEHGSFTAAAARLGVTQPTICRQIASLEEELGIQLLSRTPRGVTLTTAGSVCLEYANTLLDLENEALSHLVSITEGCSGVVHIAVEPESAGILSTCVTAFAEQYPDVQVDIDMITSFHSAEYNSMSTYEFYFMSETLANKSPDLNYLYSCRDCFHLLLHKKDAHLVNGQDFSALSSRPFLTSSHLNEPHLYGRAMSICQAHGCYPKRFGRHNHVYPMLLAVNAGLGITILPRSCMDNITFENIVTIPIEGDDAKVNSLIAWPEIEKNIAAKRFLDVVLSLYPDEKVYR